MSKNDRIRSAKAEATLREEIARAEASSDELRQEIARLKTELADVSRSYAELVQALGLTVVNHSRKIADTKKRTL